MGLKRVLNLHGWENKGEIHFGDILLCNSLSLSSLSDAGDGLLHSNSPLSYRLIPTERVGPCCPRK